MHSKTALDYDMRACSRGFQPGMQRALAGSGAPAIVAEEFRPDFGVRTERYVRLTDDESSDTPEQANGGSGSRATPVPSVAPGTYKVEL